jgi:hypothetical protein
VRVRLTTYLFGDTYLGFFKRMVKSLTWPRNKDALKGAVWSIYTTRDAHEIQEAASPLGLEIEICKGPDGGSTSTNLVKTLIMSMEKCVASGDALLTAPADTIFGEGSIETLVSLGYESYNAISVCHPRVTESFPALQEPTSNSKLVGLAFKHMHPVWKKANMHDKGNNSFNTGVTWREISRGLYAVTSRIPSPYFVRPKASDISFLSGCEDWDHVWPRQLVREERHRLVGSSDAAFMVELTLGTFEGRHGVHEDPEPDAYRSDMEHHKANRNSVVIWRSDESV